MIMVMVILWSNISLSVQIENVSVVSYQLPIRSYNGRLTGRHVLQ